MKIQGDVKMPKRNENDYKSSWWSDYFLPMVPYAILLGPVLLAFVLRSQQEFSPVASDVTYPSSTVDTVKPNVKSAAEKQLPDSAQIYADSAWMHNAHMNIKFGPRRGR